MKKAAWFGAGAALLVALLGCQTTKPALTAPAESAVQVEKNGFSPSGPAGENSLEISLLFGNSDSISSWKLDVASGSAPAVKSWTGTASYLPASLTWDGKNDSGSLAPEGTYTAKLSVTYKQKFQPGSAESRSFILDVAPPTGTITADPAVVVPTDAGVQAPVTLSIDAHSATAKMDSWSLDVLDTAGALVKSWTGQWPNPSATWDGSTMDGGHVRPDSTYSMVATVRDEFGNSAQIKSSLTVAALPPGSSAMATQPPAAPPAPPAKPGQPSIAASTLGFSPNGDHVADTLSLVVGWGQPSSVASWKASVTFRDGTVEKTWSGDGKNLPSSLTWDGKTDSGSMAPEGTYTASLSVNYGTAFAAGNATSPSFILDITPPSGTISLSSPLFSPIESSDTITLKLAATSPTAKIDSWEVDIYDPGGNVFRSLSEKWPQDSIVWNGRNSTGELVQSAEDYPVVAKVRDEFGNVGMVKSVVPVDILVEKMATGYRILASRIFFKAFTADYQDVAPDLAAQNKSRLDALAAKLKKFPGYKIRLVGHAVSIYWDDPVKGAAEQKDVLLPLSRSRADAVKAALVQRGIDEARLSTDGVGASDQLVPDSDYKDRWQNRRVALFLDK